MKKKMIIALAALLCVCATACESRSNKGFTEVQTSAAAETTAAKATEKAAEKTTEKPAETAAAQTEAAAETTTQETTAETQAPAVTEAASETQPDAPEPEPSAPEGGSDSTPTYKEALEDAYITAARSQAQLLMTACDGIILVHDISGDPLADGTYKMGDGSAVAAELDSYTDLIDYTIVIADGKTTSVTVVTQGENGTVEETVTADIN